VAALHVEKRGEGKPVLVLHGLLSNHTQMEPLLPALAGRTAYSVDLLGCGQSDKQPMSDIIEANAGHLLKLCVENNIDTVIGYSISGLIALQLQLPNTILIASFCTNPLNAGPLRFFAGKEESIEHYVTRYRENIHAVLARFRSKAVPGITEADMACAINYMHEAKEDYTSLARTLGRALVVHGSKDLLINVALGQQLAREAHARLVVVPEDHDTVLTSAAVHEAIKSFLSGC
jgi:pimeloyl-ACP methyl ester carboxylesterase